MGMRKKVRNMWKAQRKLDLVRIRKQKAIRFVKAAAKAAKATIAVKAKA